MKQAIKKLLEQVEKENDIKILFAIENGSRSWGMASKDSDYDVRFVFYRPIKKYISLIKPADVITVAFDEKLEPCEVQGSLVDMSGFDIFKYLKLLISSNPTTIEWLNSPIVYLGNNDLLFRKHVNTNFNQERLVKHYFSLFRNNYREFIELGKMITHKKYLYSMRGLVNALFVYNFDKVPPLSFVETVEKVKNMLPENVYSKLMEVIEIKFKGLEKDKITRIPEFDNFFESELNKNYTDFRKRDFDIKIFDYFLQSYLLK